MKNGPRQRLIIVLFIALTIPLIILSQQKEAISQDSASRENSHPIYRYTEGQWSVKPLVLKGNKAPGTGGEFYEFGKGFWLDSGVLVFWSRFSPKKGDWALYSLKSEQIRKVFVNRVPFTEPDSIKKKVHNMGEDFLQLHRTNNWQNAKFYHTFMFGGSRMVYAEILHKWNRNVYGWDGEHLVRILGNGDEISLFGNQYFVKTAEVLRICADGKALIEIETSKPNVTTWLVLHDGTTLTPLWGKGEPLPGMEDATVKCIFNAFFFPGATLAIMSFTGERAAVYRITQKKTEKLIGIGDEDPFNSNREIANIYIGENFSASSPETFVVMVSTKKRGASKSAKSFLQFLFYNRGKWQKNIDFSDLRESKEMDEFWVDQVIFPSPEPSFLFTVRLEEMSGSQDSASFSDLYLFVDDRLIPIPWEKTVGIDISKIRIRMQKLNRVLDPIVIHTIPGNLGGAIIELPFEYKVKFKALELEKKKFTFDWIWLFDLNSKDRQLIDFPEFKNSSEKKFRLNNVIAWKSTTEAVVKRDDGFYLITKQQNDPSR